MAQVTITHFKDQSSLNVKMWKIVIEKVTAEIVYGRNSPVPGDVTVRTLKVNQKGCASDAQTELHVEIAESNWPRTKDGRDFSVEEATVHFNLIAS